MKTITNKLRSWITSHIWLSLGLILVAGILSGSFLFGQKGDSEATATMEEEHSHVQGTIWTCSMHPQIRDDGPGSCPICGMELILVESEGSDTDYGPESQVMSEAALKIADVETSVIVLKAPIKEIYLSGRIAADERRINEITAHFPGRIETLKVNYTGQYVRKGQVLATIYSPELVSAQKELFEALNYRVTNPQLYQAARNKFKLWMITENQIKQIEESGKIQYYLDILSPGSGTVTIRNIAKGDYVKEGTSMFQIIDLSHIWVILDAYESDIPWIKLNDNIKIQIKSVPGQTFTGKVTFIDPILDSKTRVTRIRAELNNRDGILRPGMFVSGRLNAMLPGKKEMLVVPKTAVLWTGKKSIVYIKEKNTSGQHVFTYREITIGENTGSYYVVKDGLTKGEEVVTNGVFKIDASAQLLGKQSMMNPGGGKVSLSHDHGSMEQGATMEDIDIEKEEDHSEHLEQSTTGPDRKSDFNKQLKEVFARYIILKDAMVASDPEKTTAAGQIVRMALDKVNMGLLEGEAHMLWMEKLDAMKKPLVVITNSKNISKQRLAFAHFGDALYASIKSFQVTGLNAYRQFCPMADDNKGAYWLSTTKEIRNPYFGDVMLTCGSTEEILK